MRVKTLSLLFFSGSSGCNEVLRTEWEVKKYLLKEGRQEGRKAERERGKKRRKEVWVSC